MALSLAVLYIVLTALHALSQPPPVAGPMVVIAGSSALSLLALYLACRRWPAPPRRGSVLGAAMGLVVLLNSLTHLALSGDIRQTSNIAILLIGIGAYFLDWRWFVGLSAVTLCGWGLVVAQSPERGDVLHYAVWQVEALLVATVLFVTRKRLITRLARLRLHDEQQNVELAAAVRVAEQNREAAEAASRAKSTFLATMSHEMRTPLTAIIGYSELLQLQLNDRDQLTSDVQKIRQSATHLLGLIEQVLDFSKIEAGRMSLWLETFTIDSLVDEVIINTRPLITKNGNTFDVQLAMDLVPIHADRTRLRQVLINLISNAAKFTEHGSITLKVWIEPAADGPSGNGTHPTPESVVFQVCDTGIGLSPEQIDRLFVEFQQGDGSSTRRYEGVGLGLALSRRLCRLMGGDITAAGAPGQGATFTVRLPSHVTLDLEPC